MPTATYNKFSSAVEYQATSKIDWDSDVFKVMFTNVAPSNTNALKAELTEIAAGNGYPAGGLAMAMTVSRVGGTLKVVGADVVLTANGGPVGPFRYAVLYDDTVAGKPLWCWWDYGASQTLADTESFTVDMDPVAGLFTLS